MNITSTAFDNLFQVSIDTIDHPIAFVPDTHHPEYGGQVCYGPLMHRYHWMIDGRVVFEFFDVISHDVQVSAVREFIKHTKEQAPQWSEHMF